MVRSDDNERMVWPPVAPFHDGSDVGTVLPVVDTESDGNGLAENVGAHLRGLVGEDSGNLRCDVLIFPNG